MSFGTNLQFMRKMHRSMTQEELAEKLNVSRQTISKWEMDNSFPEMEKAIALTELFNCSLDELLKGDLNSGNKAFHNIRIESIAGFQYARYTVISRMPEDDAKEHICNWAQKAGISHPDIIGWDFPYVSQEQKNVYHMHGYCAACIIPENCNINPMDMELLVQQNSQYAVISIEDPFRSPFLLIPNAYKTLLQYIEINGLKQNMNKDVIKCFEKEYEVNGVTFMDVYIAVEQ